MPVVISDEEGTNLLAMFEQMGVKPEGNTPEELHQWLQVHFAATAEEKKGKGEDVEKEKEKGKGILDTGLVHQQLKLSVTFAGDETVKGTSSYDLWRYEIGCLVREGVYAEAVIKHVIRCSLKGEAAHVLKRLGPTTTVQQILQKFDGVYGTVEAGEDTLAEFYSAKQKKGEDVSTWGCRLEELLDRAMQAGVVGGKDTDEMLRKRFWMGLLSNLKEAARHKYDTIMDFDRLRVVVRSIEHEFRGEARGSSDQVEPRKTVKMAAVREEPVSPEVRELRGQIHKLTNTVNSMQQQLAKGSGVVVEARAIPSRHKGAKWHTKPKETEEGATQLRSCWHCKDPGHMKYDCPQLPECFKCHRRGHVQKYCRLNQQ